MNATDYLIEAIVDRVADIGPFRGTATDLLAALPAAGRPAGFPKTSAALADLLRQVEPDLAQLGIEVRRDGRRIELVEIPNPAAEPDERLVALARFVTARREARGVVCPRCGRGFVVAGPDGWCARCVTDRKVEQNEADRQRRAQKLRWWNSPGGGAAQRAARQAAETGDGSHVV